MSNLVIEPMQLEDIPQVLEVDRESYTIPWPASAYRREILHNHSAHYVVLRSVPDGHEPRTEPVSEWRSRLPLPFWRWPKASDERQDRTAAVVGYAGMWLMVDEAHITTVALRGEWRGRGLGELLLASLLLMAAERGAERVTLEVRVSNEPAQKLYRKYGFEREGMRPRYYSDNNEDAYIMTTGPIQTQEYRVTMLRLVKLLRERLQRDGSIRVSAPVLDAPADLSVTYGAD